MFHFLGTLIGKNGIPSHLLNFYEDFNETAENIKQKTVNVLSNYKLDHAYVFAYLADSPKRKFLANSIQSAHFLPKTMRKDLSC